MVHLRRFAATADNLRVVAREASQGWKAGGRRSASLAQAESLAGCFPPAECGRKEVALQGASEMPRALFS